MEEMGVIQARIQTVEDIYRLVRTAVSSKRPIRAVYHGRVGSCARTGWAGITKGDSCAVLSVCWGEWQWTASGWLPGKLALYCAGETQQSGVARRCMATRPTIPAHRRCVAEVDVDAED